MELDEALSRDTAKQITSKSKAVFNNTFRAALVTEGAAYVQGFLVIASRPHAPLEHSWITVGDRIIDPNLPFLSAKAEDLLYFPAQELTVKQLKAAVEEAKEDYPDDDPLPIYGSAPYEYYGDKMLGGQDYLMAHRAAEAKCQELIQAMGDRN